MKVMLGLCDVCRKAIFPHKRAAERRAKELRRKKDERLHAYRCKAGHWHLGH